MALVEQLLRDKKNLQGPALANAKIIIRRFIDDLADVLKREVASAPKGRIDTSIPPKRTFRNLDLKRTIWKNLVNWNPEEGRLYVDQLYYKRTATLNNNTRLIVVVDQSGSMLSAMVNCTILASIFAGLPKVDAHLIAFDTQVLDLSPWVHDPFEVLLRTNLGGGNDGPKAMIVARDKIVDPRNTVMVWISDFYEFSNDRPLFQMIKEVVESGVQFIPVGSVSGSGYFNVNPWFRQQFKAANIPLMSGSLKTLITELKTALP
ncbi:MAG: VWA domain-containing protein [Alphaproteobacteria bacterium]|nr:VWA domain-containing protein [Alphaproteobacteria bacterium]